MTGVLAREFAPILTASDDLELNENKLQKLF